jgi:hypothetical protein
MRFCKEPAKINVEPFPLGSPRIHFGEMKTSATW